LSKVFKGVALQLFKGLVEVEVTPSNFSAGGVETAPGSVAVSDSPK
jgi:hypothetical protein